MELNSYKKDTSDILIVQYPHVLFLYNMPTPTLPHRFTDKHYRHIENIKKNSAFKILHYFMNRVLTLVKQLNKFIGFWK